jgi:hypothetical protein
LIHAKKCPFALQKSGKKKKKKKSEKSFVRGGRAKIGEGNTNKRTARIK